MSKICKKCGVRHENRAIKCAACGTPFNDRHIYVRRNLTIILCSFLTLTIAAAVSYSIYSATPEAAVRRIMNACKKADVETAVSYYPDFYLESDKVDKTFLLMTSDMRIKKFSEDLYSFYLEEPETPSDKICEDLIEKLEYYGGDNFDREKLGEIKMIWVNYRIDIRYFWPNKATRFIVFEYDGRWCWWPENFNR